jgi:hypothetical protein
MSGADAFSPTVGAGISFSVKHCKMNYNNINIKNVKNVKLWQSPETT